MKLYKVQCSYRSGPPVPYDDRYEINEAHRFAEAESLRYAKWVGAYRVWVEEA